MRKSQLFLIIALLAMLLAISLLSKDLSKAYTGGLPWYGWVGSSFCLVIVAFLLALRDANRARRLLVDPVVRQADEQVSMISEEDLERLDPGSPDYPHPVIFPERYWLCVSTPVRTTCWR